MSFYFNRKLEKCLIHPTRTFLRNADVQRVPLKPTLKNLPIRNAMKIIGQTLEPPPAVGITVEYVQFVILKAVEGSTIVWWPAGNAAIKVLITSLSIIVLFKVLFIAAHYSCLNGDDMMLKMYPDNTWQCPHCKTCVVCYETSNAVSVWEFFSKIG